MNNNSSNQSKKNLFEHGFMLIEVSIALLIVGFFVAVAFSALKVYTEKKKLLTQEESFGTVRSALGQYVSNGVRNYDQDSVTAGFQQHPDCVAAGYNTTTDIGKICSGYRYPCPAPINAPLTSANFGLEISDGTPAGLPPHQQGCEGIAVGGAPAGVFAVNGHNGGRVLIGAVPFRELGIPYSETIDAYKNRIYYAVSANLTPTGAFITENVNGQIELLSDDGTVIRDNNHFLLMSSGENAVAAYTVEGVLINNTICNGTTEEHANCDFVNGDTSTSASSFVVKELYSATGVEEFDDTIAFTFSDGSESPFWERGASTGIANENVVNKNPQDVYLKSGSSFGVGEEPHRSSNQRHDIDIYRGDNVGSVRIAGTGDANSYSSLFLDDGQKDTPIGAATLGNPVWSMSHRKATLGASEGDFWIDGGTVSSAQPRMAISSSTGNVGFNTSNPHTNMHLVVEQAVGGGMLIEGTNPAGAQVALHLVGTGDAFGTYTSLVLDDGQLNGGNIPWVLGQRGGSGAAAFEEGDFILQHGPGGNVIFMADADRGYVGIANTNPQYHLDVIGQVQAINYFYRSDIRSKKDIEDLSSDYLKDIMDVRTIKHRYKDDVSVPPSPKFFGFIAQDLQKHFPEMVTESENGDLTVDYPRMIVPTIKALQELKIEKDAEILKLQEEIDSLKKSYEDRLQKLENGISVEYKKDAFHINYLYGLLAFLSGVLLMVFIKRKKG